VQDTGCSPWGAGCGSAQSSAYDTEDPERQAGYVQCYGTLGLRYHWLRTNMQERQGSKVILPPFRFREWGQAIKTSQKCKSQKSQQLFPAVAGSLESPDGPIHMLVGMDQMKDAPREQARREGIVLNQYEFSTGHVACADINGMVGTKEVENSDPRVFSCRSILFNPPEFIPAEAMGTELPR
jgi:hypothetical protein